MYMYSIGRRLEISSSFSIFFKNIRVEQWCFLDTFWYEWTTNILYFSLTDNKGVSGVVFINDESHIDDINEHSVLVKATTILKTLPRSLNAQYTPAYD